MERETEGWRNADLYLTGRAALPKGPSGSFS